MENIRGYNIRKTVKISGTNVRLFLRDNESTPVFSFADLVRAVFGEDNPGPIVLAKQIPEKNKANLIGKSGDSSIVVDFEGLSFFLVDKMEAKFAKTTIDYIREYLNKESRKLPSPVKVVSKSSIREEKIDEEFKRQYMVQTEDGRSQRYLKIRGFRWFNGVDIRSNYCGSSDEYFNSIVENLKDEYRFKTLMDEVGTVTFLSEQGLIELLKETTPDRYKSVYENILEQCLENEKELSGEKEEFVLESKQEEPEEEKPKALLELLDVYKMRKNLKNSIKVSELKIRKFATPDYSFRLLNYNGTVFASVDDVQKSVLNPKNKEYEGSSTLKFASAERNKYLGEFAKLYDVLNCFLDGEKLLEVLEKVKLFVSPPPIEKVEVKPKKEAGVKMNKYYTPDPIPGRVVAWTDLQMNVPVFTVFIEDKEGFVPLFKANDIGNYAGFSDATSLTRKYVNEKLYTKVSINEIHRNNMRMLNADGVHDLIVASGKFADKTVADTLTRDLKAAATDYLLENEKDIKFRIDKWNTEEAVKQEPAIEESPAKENKEEKAAKEPTAETDKDEYTSTVCINSKFVRIIIKRSSDRDVIPYYCVEDFCDAWGLDVNAVKSHISDGMTTISKKDKDGSVIFVSYADMSAIAMFENGEARTMVSNTMKASGGVFKEACASFGIDFNNDTERDKRIGHYSDREKTERDKRVGHYSDREKSESIDTRKPGSMEQLLSHSENGYAYTVGAIILAERIRNVLSYLSVCNSKIESGLPGPTSKNLVKKLWMYIDAQDPQAEAGTAFQQTVVAANERYSYLLDAAKSISKA